MKWKINTAWIPVLALVLAVGVIIGRASAPDASDRGGFLERGEVPRARVGSSSPEVSSVRRVTGRSVFDGVKAEDFESIAREAADSPDEIGSEAMLRVLVSEWAKKDALAAIAFAKGLKRDDLICDALLQMAQSDVEGALNWVASHGGAPGQERGFLMAVYQGMAKKDPVGAIARLEQLPVGAQRDELLSLTVNQWAKQDIKGAFSWLETAELTPQFASIYQQVMGNYIEQDPDSAAAVISEMASCESKLSFAPQVACKLAEKDVGSALEWVHELDGEERKYALMGVLDRWAGGADGKGALEYVLQNSDEPGYGSLLETVAFKIAQNDPDELAGVMASMGEPEQLVAAQHLASVYSMSSPSRCRDWLETLEAGAVRDRAVERALGTFRSSNISLAFDLSESISSESLRNAQVREVMSVWMAVDAQAAENALADSSVLSGAEKGSLLTELHNNLKPNDFVIPAGSSF
ncbi:hypothetical protein ACFQY0_13580 [Haloferula chungangensis]|uniref:HEAT repeat domain-containing protein n=1 Tax=Haloferula chungangensis TaxID=1048331 RepID=A0ABW2L743_9BACT